MILSYLQAGEVLKCSVPKTRANTARCVGSIMRFLALCTCTVCMAQQTGCTWRPTQTKPVKAKVHQLASQAKMTSGSGVALAYWYVQRLNEWRVPGDIVECGVWKGGVSAFMAVAQLEASEHELAQDQAPRAQRDARESAAPHSPHLQAADRAHSPRNFN